MQDTSKVEVESSEELQEKLKIIEVDNHKSIQRDYFYGSTPPYQTLSRHLCYKDRDCNSNNRQFFER